MSGLTTPSQDTVGDGTVLRQRLRSTYQNSTITQECVTIATLSIRDHIRESTQRTRKLNGR